MLYLSRECASEFRLWAIFGTDWNIKTNRRCFFISRSMTADVNASIQLFVYLPHHEISKPTFEKRSNMQATSLPINRWHCRLVDRQDVSADAACNVRDFAKRPLTEILPAELLQRFCTEILPGHLLWRYCTETLHRDLPRRSCQEVSYINLAKRTLLESLHRGFKKRPCTETLHRNLLRSAKWSFTEILPRELLYRACIVQGSHKEMLPRDLFYRSCRGGLAKRSLIEILFRDLAKRPLTEILPRGLLQRSCTEILPGDLLWRSCTETWWREPRSCSEIVYR